MSDDNDDIIGAPEVPAPGLPSGYRTRRGLEIFEVDSGFLVMEYLYAVSPDGGIKIMHKIQRAIEHPMKVAEAAGQWIVPYLMTGDNVIPFPPVTSAEHAPAEAPTSDDSSEA